MKKQPPSKKKPRKPSSKKQPSKKPHSNVDDDLFDLGESVAPAKKAPAKPVATFNELGHGPRLPDVDKLAAVAAIVMRDGMDADKAVKTALDIYDSCIGWLRTIEMEEDNYYFPNDEDDCILFKSSYTYKEAAKIVTSQPARLGRALEYFKDFGLYMTRADESLKTDEERLKRLEERIEFRKKQGFSDKEVVNLKKGFEKYFPNRRKKALDLIKNS